MKEIKQLAGQTLIYGLGTMVPRLLNYVILTPYFTYTLFANNIAEYGKVTELYAYIAFLMIVLTYGMETTFFRFTNIEKDRQKVFSSIFSSLTSTSLLFLGIILVFQKSISQLLKYEGEVYFIGLLAGILAVEAITAIPFAKLRVENRAKKFAILKFIQIILNIGLMLGIYNVWPYLSGNINYLLNDSGNISARFIFLSNLISSGVVLLLLVPEMREFKIKKVSFSFLKPMLVYGLPLMISGLAGTINETLDRSVYKYVIEDQDAALYDLGIYGANYKIGGLLLIFIQMFRYAAEPYFFNKAKDRDAKTQYAQLMNIFTGVIILMGLGIILYLDILKYFINVNFHEGLTIIPYIVLAYVFYGMLFNLSVWYKLSNKTSFALVIMISGAIITIIINLIYIPQFRYNASAFAHVCSYGFMVLLSYFLGRRYYRIQYNILRIGVYFLLGTCIFIVDKFVTFEVNIIELIFRTILLLLFAIFVAWKEKIYFTKRIS